MSLTSLKNNLHHLIDTVEEEALLETINEMVESLIKNQSSELWDSLREAEKQAIEEGLQQKEAGLVISHQAVKEKYGKWFTK